MSTSTVINEDILAEVVEVTQRGRGGSYQNKVVQVNGKDHVVSKNDKDKVQVGKSYHFRLTKSEYNDKLYYWANLIEDKEPESSSEKSEDDFKRQAFAWMKKLDTEKKKEIIKYLLDRI